MAGEISQFRINMANRCHLAEELANIAAYIGLAAGIRATAALVQIVASVIFPAFYGVFGIAEKEAREMGTEYLKHGFANLGRAIIEGIPIINLVLIYTDWVEKLRFSYEGEDPHILKHTFEHLRDAFKTTQPSAESIPAQQD